MKVLKSEVATDAKRIERFLREAKAAAGLHHPNIVAVFDAGQDGDRYYIASALIDGKPLADSIPEGGAEFARSARLARELAEALAYAHGQGVVHRDVKPANAMVDARGRVHLMDFGLAARSDEESKLTSDGAVMGTPAYMSPEQAKGQKGEAQPATDQYAVGVVLYELLTGTVPFAGPLAAVLHNVVHTEPDPPGKFRSGVPKDLETICLKAMAKRPEDRYANCQELADDLRRWLEGEPIAARRMGFAERATRWVRKNPAAAATGIVTALAAALVAVALALWGMYQNSEELRGVAVEERAKAEAKEAEAKEDRSKAEAARGDAERERENAKAAEARTKKLYDELVVTQEKLARNEYGQAMRNAYQEWRELNVGVCRLQLDAASPELRGWEWRYLHRVSHSELLTVEEGGSATGVSFSPDGSRIAVVSGDHKAVRVRDSRTGAELFSLNGHATFVSSASFNRDGTRIVTGSRDKTAKVWDAKTGDEILTLKGHAEWVNAASFSPDGSRIVTLNGYKAIKVWDAKSGGEVGGVNLDSLASHAALNAGGTRVVACMSRAAKVYDVKTGAELLTTKGENSSILAASYNPVGTLILTTNGRAATLWNATTGSEIRSFKGHLGIVRTASFSADGSRIVTACDDHTARVWDVGTGAELLALRGHLSAVSAAAFSPDGNRIATASADRTVKFWDAQVRPDALTLTGNGYVHAAAFSRDGSRIVSASAHTARVWDARTGATLLTLKGHSDYLTSTAFSPDGTRILTGSQDRTTKVWDAKTGAELFTIKGHGPSPGAVLFSPDGSRIVTGGFDKTMKVWDAKTGAELSTFSGYGSSIPAFSRDGLRILASGYDGVARVRDANTGTELLKLNGQFGVLAGDFSPDGSRIVTASFQQAAKVWDAKAGTELLTLKGHIGGVATASFSPDGSRIVTGGFDSTVRVWDVRTGAELFTIKVQTPGSDWKNTFRLYSTAFSPDGYRILTSDGFVIYSYDSQPFKETLRELEQAKPEGSPKAAAKP